MLSRNKGIILAAVMTIILYGLLVFMSEKDLRAENKTVTAYQATKYIPVGTHITDNDIKEIQFPEKYAINLVQDLEYLNEKVTAQSIGEGQYIFENSVIPGSQIRPGYKEILIPTDLSKSALAFPGEKVDLYPFKSYDSLNLPPLYEAARVTKTLDQEGRFIDPSRGETLKGIAATGNMVPVSIGVEVPDNSQELLSQIVNYASGKNIYLVKNAPDGDK